MKRSRFFCENCRSEVRPHAKVCPHCGRFFESVRCPVCSYVGEADSFVRGCPTCGYAGDSATRQTGFERVEYRARPTGATKPATPRWVWPLALTMIVVAFVALVLIYLNL